MMNRRRLFVGLVLALLVGVTLSANLYDFEQLTIDNTATGKGFTAAKITPAGQVPMTLAQCRVETAEIRYLYVDPLKIAVTASVGTQAEPGEFITITGREEILNFRAIRTGATSATLSCTYRAVQ